MKFFPSAILITLLVSLAPMPAIADVSVSINIAPPDLPVYKQPMLPGDGYIWTPGYWAYSEGDYYWVPGTWVLPPRIGYLWTPGYWIWDDRFYVFRSGYWGPHVGYYGGVNYGYGYGGHGYDGGRWDHGRFNYNRSANRIDVNNLPNTYNQTVINNVAINRTSYNGGEGGLHVRPSARDEARERETHVGATSDQARHEQAAHGNPELRQSANHGHPPIAATPRPAAFGDRGAMPARGTDEHAANGQRSEARTRADAVRQQAPDAGYSPQPGQQRDRNADRAQGRVNAPEAMRPDPEQRRQPVPPPRNIVRPEQQRPDRSQQQQRQEQRQQEHQQQRPPEQRPQQQPRQEHQQQRERQQPSQSPSEARPH